MRDLETILMGDPMTLHELLNELTALIEREPSLSGQEVWFKPFGQLFLNPLQRGAEVVYYDGVHTFTITPASETQTLFLAERRGQPCRKIVLVS